MLRELCGRKTHGSTGLTQRPWQRIKGTETRGT